ncbi:hypothetical protein BDW22DRAFT_1417124 [Trametopsis cervina]|nr:hypothetical protein BDW22DRAFT_1417124 [Trametopsis cervina]
MDNELMCTSIYIQVVDSETGPQRTSAKNKPYSPFGVPYCRSDVVAFSTVARADTVPVQNCAAICPALDIENNRLFATYHDTPHGSIDCYYTYTACEDQEHICTYALNGTFVRAADESECELGSFACPTGAPVQCTLPPQVTCQVTCPAVDGNGKALGYNVSYPNSGPPGGILDCVYPTYLGDGSHDCQYYLVSQLATSGGYYACPNAANVVCTTSSVSSPEAVKTA